MPKIASWNINSVRLRIDLVLDFLGQAQPDILCLQETKTEDEFFPRAILAEKGYIHQHICGQKSYNGVAIISKIPFEEVDLPQGDFLQDNKTRLQAVRLENGIILRNFYIPAGGDIADEVLNDKFAHKMNLLRHLHKTFYAQPTTAEIIVGDFNIAPHEHDVWSHKQLLKVVSHTPQEVELLNQLKKSADFIDIFRDTAPHPATDKIYSWWSYRGKDWQKSNRGRRLDHIWCSRDLSAMIGDKQIYQDYRGKDRPSDHVPIMVQIHKG